MGNMSSKAIYEIKARRGVGSPRPRGRGICAISEEAVPGGRSVAGSYRQLSVDDKTGCIDDHVNHVQDSSDTSAITDATNGDGEVIDKIDELADAVPAVQGTPGDGTITSQAKKTGLVCVTAKSNTLPKKLSPDTIGIFERRERNYKSFSPYKTTPSEKMKARISMFEEKTAKKRSFSDIDVAVPQTSVKKLISKFDYHTGEVVVPESSVKKLISKYECNTELPMKAPNKLGHQFVKAFSEAKADIKNTRIDTFELKGEYVSLNMFLNIIIDAKNAIFDNKIKNSDLMKDELRKWRELIDANKRNSSFDQLKLDIGNLCWDEDEENSSSKDEWEKKLTLLRNMANIVNRIEYLDNIIGQEVS